MDKLQRCVSKNRGGPPKWMVYNGKTRLKWMIWGYHYFRKHPYQLVGRISSINCTLGTRVCQGHLDFHPTFATSFVNLRTPSQTGNHWSNFFPIHKDNGSLSCFILECCRTSLFYQPNPMHSWEAPEICDTFAACLISPKWVPFDDHLFVPVRFLFVLGALPSGNTRRQWNREATPPAADGRLNSQGHLTFTPKRIFSSIYKVSFNRLFKQIYQSVFQKKKSRVKTSFSWSKFQVHLHQDLCHWKTHTHLVKGLLEGQGDFGQRKCLKPSDLEDG